MNTKKASQGKVYSKYPIEREDSMLIWQTMGTSDTVNCDSQAAHDVAK